jgi:hypothetical protein
LFPYFPTVVIQIVLFITQRVQKLPLRNKNFLGKLHIRAIKDISQGEEVNISYISDDHYLPTEQRQATLLASKFFVCKCKRCVDPSEGIFEKG